MSLSLEEITKEALELPFQERAELAENLAISLDSGESKKIEALWIEEALRRRDEIRSGAVKSIPWEQVDAEIRQIVAG